jgi:hypothetical protein
LCTILWVTPLPTPRTCLMGIARTIDALPIAPSKIAERAIARFFAKRRSLQKKDPGWVAIEERRRIPGQSAKIFLSGNVTLADQGDQDRIGRRLLGDPWWLPLARRAGHWRLASVVASKLDARVRAKVGWAPRDLWNFDGYLSTLLAGALDELAETSHGWPSDLYDSPEQWKLALHANAQALRAYTQGDPEATARWHKAATTRGCEKEASALMERKRAADDARRVGARDALHWLADNFGALWD